MRVIITWSHLVSLKRPALTRASTRGRLVSCSIRTSLGSVSFSETTLDIYAKAMTPAKLEAQGWVLEQLLTGNLQSAVAQAGEKRDLWGCNP